MKIITQLYNNNLLASLTLAFILGLVCARQLNLAISTACLLLIAASCTLAHLYLRLKHALTFASIPLMLLLFTAGLTSSNLSSQAPPSPNHVFNIIDTPTDSVIIGHLTKMVAFNSFSSQAEIAIQTIATGKDKIFTPAHGKVLVKLLGPWPDQYPPGTMLAIRTTLQRPSRYMTPGAFDYPSYLAKKNIWITGFSRSPAQLHNVSSPSNPSRFFVEQTRNEIGNAIDEYTTPDNGALYRALLLGDRSRIPNETLELFKASGVMHIFAISGVHMTIIASLLFHILYWLFRRSSWFMLNYNVKKVAGLACLPFLITYMLLAGSNAPVLRAGIMSGIVIIAFCIDRPKTLSSLIALGALFILAVSPQSIYTASFLLSFIAFSSIALILPLLQKLLIQPAPPQRVTPKYLMQRIALWFAGSLIVSLTATLGTAPLALYFFNRFPLTGPFANLIIEPLICLWALPLGFMALPFLQTIPWLSEFLLQAGTIGLKLAVCAASHFHSIPHTNLWLTKPPIMLIASYYCSFFIMLSVFATQSHIRRKLATIAPFALCLTLLLSPIPISNYKHSQGLASTYILDVGQGSATVLHLNDGTTILIDGGGSTFSTETVGQRIIAPFLWSKGITRLDKIIVTHPDTDHFNGIPFLLEHFSPTQVWVNTITDGSKDYINTLHLARQGGVQIIQGQAGDIIYKGDVTVQCIANTTIHSDGERNSGLVIEVKTPKNRILFPGDIGSQTEEELIRAHPDLTADILLAAHHGSSSSNSPAFLKHIKPKAIIASAGKTRSHIFPSKKLKEYCNLNQLPLFITAKKGTVKIDQHKEYLDVFILDGGSGNPLRRKQHTWLPTQRIDTRTVEGSSTPR